MRELLSFKRLALPLIALALIAGLYSVGLSARAEETVSATSSTKERLLKLERLKQAQVKVDETKRALEKRADTFKTQAEEKREGVNKAIEERVGEAKERVVRAKQGVVDSIKSRIEQFVSGFVKKFTVAIERLSAIAERIASRIEKLEEKGVDVAKAEEALNDARAEIAEAKVKTEALLPSLENILSSEDPRAAFAEAKKDIREAHLAIVNARQALSAVMKEIRNVAGEQADEETPAPQE